MCTMVEIPFPEFFQILVQNNQSSCPKIITFTAFESVLSFHYLILDRDFGMYKEVGLESHSAMYSSSRSHQPGSS